MTDDEKLKQYIDNVIRQLKGKSLNCEFVENLLCNVSNYLYIFSRRLVV